jgi:hypothetical protein
VSRRSRIVGFGSAALLVVAGGVCTVVLAAGLGQDLALGVLGLGVVEAVSLVFLEVGFSEDRARAREEAARERHEAAPQSKGTEHPDGAERAGGRLRGRSLGRRRGHPRRPR